MSSTTITAQKLGRVVLDIRNLNVKFAMDTGTVFAVNNVNFQIHQGETVGIVGETGAGKSVTAFSVMRLLGAGGKTTRARIEGEIILKSDDGRELNVLKLDDDKLLRIRGNVVSMIYQEPMTSLNPVYTCGNQIAEVFRKDKTRYKTKQEITAASEELLDSVGIPDPKRVLRSYPHELSGGMKQRVMIAMALALKPTLIIADEPTTAIDVTIQAQILNLFQRIQEDYGTSVMFITHDLGVIAQLVDRDVVMYAGRTVEIASVYDLFEKPLHPYTKGLLKSIPKTSRKGGKREELEPIPGSVPNPANLPPGCPFHPRCEWAIDVCRSESPSIEVTENGHSVMCWRWKELQEDRG